MSNFVKKNVLMDADAMRRAIVRISHEIIEKNKGVEDVVLVGIHTLGVPLAERLAVAIEKIEDVKVPVGMVDITMYRDDIGTRSMLPRIHETVIPFDVNDREIILVDDVLSSGRTIRAALDALTDYGRPGLIRLAVLVDRGEPEFPIRADFVGFNVSLPAERKVLVCFESDSNTEAGIYDVKWQNK